MIKRGVIVARIKPGAQEKVAAVFAESDATELPRLAGIRHRSLYVLDDLYIHIFESEGDAAAAVNTIRDHPLFREISKKLEPYVSPYNPETWRSPKDATARVFYEWNAETAHAQAKTKAS
jgi:cyclase